MTTRRSTVTLLLSGLLLSLGSCATDVGYYLLNAAIDYLPDLIDAWTEASTTTT